MIPHDVPNHEVGDLDYAFTDVMGCYLEWICPCKHAFVLRAGPVAWEYGDDFLHAAAGSVQADGVTAVMKALTSTIIPKWLRWLIPLNPIRPAHIRAMVRCMNRHGLKPIWERKQKNRPGLGFVPRLVKGRAKSGLG